MLILSKILVLYNFWKISVGYLVFTTSSKSKECNPCIDEASFILVIKLFFQYIILLNQQHADEIKELEKLTHILLHMLVNFDLDQFVKTRVY